MKQTVLRLAALLLCTSLLWGCTAGQASTSQPLPGQETEQQTAEDIQAHSVQNTVLRLGYFAREGHNPYLSDNQYLRQTASLIFQNLVDIGPEMELRYGAASSVVLAENEAIITLRAGTCFSTGKNATGEDLAASLGAAMASAAYGERFANVLAVSAEGDAVTLELAEPDPLFAYLLDIPLLRADEVESIAPLAASGRFAYSEAEHALLPNPYFSGEGSTGGAVERVEFTDVTGYDALLAALGAGGVDMFASESEGVQASGTVALQTGYPLNHLVFLGFNRSHEALALPEARAAIAALADREKIIGEAYAERAYAATGLFNPLYGFAADSLYQTTAGDSAANTLGAALEGAGYTRQGGFYTGQDGERLSLRLLVYTGSAGKWAAANLLAEALRTAGVEVALDEETDFAQYGTKIAEGDFDLYIGEVKLYNNMDFSRLFAAEEYGVALDGDSALLEKWTGFREGGVSAAGLEAAFKAETPFVPLVWRTGTVYHTKRLGGFTASLSDMLYRAGELTLSAN